MSLALKSMLFLLVGLLVAVDDAIIFFPLAEDALLAAISTKHRRCLHLRSTHTWDFGTAVLVEGVDECLFELRPLLPAMAAGWGVCVFDGLDQSFQSHIFPAAGSLKLRAALQVVSLHALDCFRQLLVVLHCNLLLVVTHMNQLPGCH